MAESRCAALGLHRVSFQQAPLENLDVDGEFDAVIGRYILLHLRAPDVVLRNIARLVRPGGVIAFHEVLAYPPSARSAPAAPLWDMGWRWAAMAMGSMGAQIDVAARLRLTFQQAGLPVPRITCESPVDGGPESPFYGWMAETVRTLLPRIVALGVATDAEVDIDTLEERVRQQATEVNSQLIGPQQFCAWT